MKLTKEQTDALRSLQQSGTGKVIVSIFEDICFSLCDIRNIETPSREAKEARADLVRFLEETLIKPLKLVNPQGKRDSGTYE